MQNYKKYYNIKNLEKNTDFFKLPDESLSSVREIETDTDVKLFIKREDLVHPYLSGNKWRKLKYNLAKAKEEGKKTLLTFGGAYSNHIYAVASAGKLFDFNTIGIIRGEEEKVLNPTLSFALYSGMKLDFISREAYRQKSEPAFIEQLMKTYGDFYLIPEGGTNMLAILGCTEILTQEEYSSYDYICCCSGTGGTIAGLIAASNGKSRIIGFSALRGDFLKNEVENLLWKYAGRNFDNWEMCTDYHFGGYAKTTSDLNKFTTSFMEKTGIPTEFVYTGKMFYGIYDLIAKGFFPSGSRVLALHTGGLRI